MNNRRSDRKARRSDDLARAIDEQRRRNYTPPSVSLDQSPARGHQQPGEKWEKDQGGLYGAHRGMKAAHYSRHDRGQQIHVESEQECRKPEDHGQVGAPGRLQQASLLEPLTYGCDSRGRQPAFDGDHFPPVLHRAPTLGWYPWRSAVLQVIHDASVQGPTGEV